MENDDLVTSALLNLSPSNIPTALNFLNFKGKEVPCYSCNLMVTESLIRISKTFGSGFSVHVYPMPSNGNMYPLSFYCSKCSEGYKKRRDDMFLSISDIEKNQSKLEALYVMSQ